MTTAVRTVNSLSINMDLLNLDKIVDLMRLFPCLEKLHVKVFIRHSVLIVFNQLGFDIIFYSDMIKFSVSETTVAPKLVAS